MIEINTDKELLDKEVIYQFLSQSYWAKNRPIHAIDLSIENSLCFGLYKNKKQIGFARLVSDYAVYAYIMDVFIIEAEQGNGFGKQLIQYIIDYPPLSLVKTWDLATETAHTFYKNFGFEALVFPERMMRRIIP